MGVDISYFLDTHSVMGITRHTIAETGPMLLYNCTNMPEIDIDSAVYSVWIFPFSIDSKPKVSNDVKVDLIRIECNSKYFRSYIMLDATQTATEDEYTVKIRHSTTDDGELTAGTGNLEVGTTYLHTILMRYVSDTVYRLESTYIIPVTYEYQPHVNDSVLSFGSEMDNDCSIGGVGQDLDEIECYSQGTVYAGTYTARFYEPHYVGDGGITECFSKPLHLMFGAERTLTGVIYNEPSDLSRFYLMPPLEAVDGSVFDHSDYFTSVIDEQNDEIEALQSDLDDANAEIAVLEERLSASWSANLLGAATAIFDGEGLLSFVNFRDIVKSLLEDINDNPGDYIGAGS